MFKWIGNLFKSSSSTGNSVTDASSHGPRTRYAKRERNILDTIRDIHVARGRIRAEYINNSSLAAAINCVSNFTVGSNGVSVVFNSEKKSARRLDLIDRVQEQWRKWAWSSKCDTELSSNLMNVQWQICNNVRLDGFVFFEVIHDLTGIFIRTHSCDRLADNLHEDLDNGNFIRFGVEYNASRIKVAYWFRGDDELKKYLHGGIYTGDSRKSCIRYPVDKMMMCYRPDRIGMPFGLPSLLSCFLTGRSIKTFTDAELQKQSIASSITGFITSELEESDAPLMDIQKPPIGGGYTERDKQRNLDTLDIPISTMERLRDGESVTFPNPPNSENFSSFTDQILGFMSMSQGITKEFFLGDFSKTNYSSARMAASINSLPTSALRKNVIQAQLLEMVIPVFLENLYLAKNFPRQVTDLGWNYLAPTMPAVDPVKQAKADMDDLNNGIKSLTTIMTERGLNPEKEFDKIREEREKYKDVFEFFKQKEPKGAGELDEEEESGSNQEGNSDNPEEN